MALAALIKDIHTHYHAYPRYPAQAGSVFGDKYLIVVDVAEQLVERPQRSESKSLAEVKRYAHWYNYVAFAENSAADGNISVPF